jgi:predicted ATP-dependent Lon-type protease
MSKPKLSDEEITQRGREIYNSSIRSQVETPENIGKIVSINVETGEYEVGDDLLVTSLQLRVKQE